MASSSSAVEAFEDAEEFLDGSLGDLVEQDKLKWIFVGGKGGVGKTTTSCSLAVELAKRRESVLLISTDPAHNISDAFQQKFTGMPTLVNGFNNLLAMEIDTSFTENVEFELKKDDGIKKFLQELVSSFPGADEAMGFAELMQNVHRMDYSVIVFDTAPTGHTLRLLGFPQLLEKGLSKLGSLKSKFGGALEMLSSMTDQDMNEAEAVSRIDNLRNATATVKEMFQDPTKCTFVCVCIPEFLSVYETERLVQELCRHGIDVSNIVVNQVLFPEDCGEDIRDDEDNDSGGGADSLDLLAAQINAAAALPESERAALVAIAEQAAKRMRSLEKGWDMCRKKRKMQQRYLSQIMDLYRDDFHIVAIPMLGEEVRGLAKLKIFSNLLLSGDRRLPVHAV